MKPFVFVCLKICIQRFMSLRRVLARAFSKRPPKVGFFWLSGGFKRDDVPFREGLGQPSPKGLFIVRGGVSVICSI
jgi:hypothetical protein